MSIKRGRRQSLGRRCLWSSSLFGILKRRSRYRRWLILRLPLLVFDPILKKNPLFFALIWYLPNAPYVRCWSLSNLWSPRFLPAPEASKFDLRKRSLHLKSRRSLHFLRCVTRTKWLTRVHERNEGGEWREVRVGGKNDDWVAVLLDSRLQSVEELREKRAAATENQPVRFDSPSIGHNRAIRQVRLIQKLRQRAEQGRLLIESKTISLKAWRAKLRSFVG